MRYHHDGLTDKDVAIAIPESNGTDGQQRVDTQFERPAGASLIHSDAQREDEAAARNDVFNTMTSEM